MHADAERGDAVKRRHWRPRRLAVLFSLLLMGAVAVAVIGQWARPAWTHHHVLQEIARAGGTASDYHGREITYVDLSNATGTDRAVRGLKNAPNLAELNLSGSDVTDSTLASLRGLPNLASINLNDTHISGSGLRLLEGLPSLHRLDLANTAINDEDLAYLQRFPVLHVLDLSGTRVTNEGLAHLRLPAINHVDLRGTQVTEAAADELQTVLRGAIEIVSGPRP